MTVAYLPGPAAILLRSDLRRRPRTRGGEKKKEKEGAITERSRGSMRETEAMDVEAPLELIDRLSTSPGFVEWKKYGSRRAADVIYTGRGRDGTACMISYCSFAAGIVTLRLTTLSRSSVLLTLFALSLKKLRRDQRRPLIFLSNSSWIIPMYEVFSKTSTEKFLSSW